MKSPEINIPGIYAKTSPAEAERREKPYTLERAYNAAAEIIVKEAIDPQALLEIRGGPYSQQGVYADVFKAKKIQTELLEGNDAQMVQDRKLSKVMEVALGQQINKGWLGERTKAIFASLYDDLVNKIDLVLEIMVSEDGVQAPSALSLGIDVTYSRDVKRKIHDIKEEIDSGDASTVKYYQSSNGSFVGSVVGTPRLVLGMDEHSAETVARAWYGKNAALNHDPLREKALIQLIDQCQAFAAYAIKVKQVKIAHRYEQAGNLFTKALGGPVTQDIRRRFIGDKVFRTLELLIHDLDLPAV